MDAIGGYFGLELQRGEHYHKDAIRLNTGRNCFEYILRARKYKKVYIPYYTCEVILEPLNKLRIAWEYYSIDCNFEPILKFQLKESDAFLYTNYWGLKQSCVAKLSQYYGKQLIVDNSQAFFSLPIFGIDTFYSARKFFGVADGAYLYTEMILNEDLEEDYSSKRMMHLLNRIESEPEASYLDFIDAEKELNGRKIKKMSKLTEQILSSLDYEWIKKRRCTNFKLLSTALTFSNLLNLDLSEDAVPMIYPYLPKKSISKSDLIAQKIFVATYWKNVVDLVEEKSKEYQLVSELIPLIVDQRYDKEDMNKCIKIIMG